MHAIKQTVGAVAAPIEALDPDGGWVWVYNKGAVDIYIGGANVDAAGANGYPVVQATQVGPISISSGEQLYAISSGASNPSVYVLQSGEVPK